MVTTDPEISIHFKQKQKGEIHSQPPDEESLSYSTTVFKYFNGFSCYF